MPHESRILVRDNVMRKAPQLDDAPEEQVHDLFHLVVSSHGEEHGVLGELVDNH